MAAKKPTVKAETTEAPAEEPTSGAQDKEIPAAIVERAARMEANPTLATEATPPASDIKYENRPEDEGDVNYVGVPIVLQSGEHEGQKGYIRQLVEHDNEGKATKALFYATETPNTGVVIEVDDIQVEVENPVDNEEAAAAEEEAAQKAEEEAQAVKDQKEEEAAAHDEATGGLGGTPAAEAEEAKS